MTDTEQKDLQAEKPQKQKKEYPRFNRIRSSVAANIVFSVIVPAVMLVMMEWVARGTLGAHKQGNGFFQSLYRHFPSFLVAFLFLVALYVCISQLTKKHFVATLVLGLLCYPPAVATYYKNIMRNEPFLPWDLSQIGDLMAISDNITLRIQPGMIIALVLLVVLVVVTAFIKVPKGITPKTGLVNRLIVSGTAFAMALLLLFGVFLNVTASETIGIHEDMWLQDRYYRNHGVVTGFLTNLRMLNVPKPAGYSEGAVNDILQQMQESGTPAPYYENSYAAQTDKPVQDPDIIFVMAESFWDVTRLEGIVYDQPLLTNLQALQKEGAYGWVMSPSFGGGTCDVEFEALTGYAMENLPAASKPFQQYITEDVDSFPAFLKGKGYSTTAIHGFGAKFWNRDVAYPRLGIDTFISEDDFVNPKYRRGFLSDECMVEQVIHRLGQADADEPQFIHAVTMQNHTTYDSSRYPADELVRVLKSPEEVTSRTVDELQDCATGIREMDAALGQLVEYLRDSDRPTLLVFWGDHLNPMTDGLSLFEGTGFIEPGDTGSHKLREVPLLMWSNYADNQVDLGTLSAYNIGPVMNDLYGLEQPLMFEYLAQQYGILHGRTRGHTIEPDNTITDAVTEQQQQVLDDHAILQYDALFGAHYARERSANSNSS